MRVLDIPGSAQKLSDLSGEAVFLCFEGEKFMRERRWALAVERDRADGKWAPSEEEEENGEEDNDSNSDES
jgi:hypothetical protein